MPLPVIPTLGHLSAKFSKKLGRTLYRRGSRFVSKGAFESETKRRASGLFAQARGPNTVQRIADGIMDEFGPPIGGGNWVSRVRGSTEKFSDMLANDNQLG